jgi:hypothetical protein
MPYAPIDNQHKQQFPIHFAIPIDKNKIVQDNRVSLNLNNKVKTDALQNNKYLLYATVIWNEANTAELNWSLTYSTKVF